MSLAYLRHRRMMTAWRHGLLLGHPVRPTFGVRSHVFASVVGVSDAARILARAPLPDHGTEILALSAAWAYIWSHRDHEAVGYILKTVSARTSDEDECVCRGLGLLMYGCYAGQLDTSDRDVLMGFIGSHTAAVDERLARSLVGNVRSTKGKGS